MRILADPNMPLLSLFDELGVVRTVPGREWTNDHVKQADVLLTRSVTRVNAELLKNARIKFVGSATSGFDHIDRELLDQLDIHFSYCPGSNAVSVADYIVAAVLRLKSSDQPLENMTAGIIGYGHVGQAVTQKLSALGMTCLINDPPREEAGLSDVTYVSLNQALQADVISLHTPLEGNGKYPTIDLLQKVQLDQIRENSILINAARGRVINENDLLMRLDNGSRIKTVIDCWEGEPLINKDLLAKADIATPHIAGYSYDGKLKATRMLYEDLCAFLDKKKSESTEETESIKTITLDKSNSDEALKKLIEKVYPIERDHKRFIETISLSDQERKLAFDQQRKNYPERREFDQFQVQIPVKLSGLNSTSGKLSLAQRLMALGFHLT